MNDSSLPTHALSSLGCDESATIRQVMETIERGRASAAVITRSGGRFVGIVTDGDVRRALLSGATLDDPVLPLVRRSAVTVAPTESRSAVLDLMRARSIRQLPIVDSDGFILGVHLLNELIGMVPRPNTALILAGGRGTRLHPLTEQVPKPMLTVAGRPILDRIISHLVGYGITSIVISVGHLGEQIQDYFGDGSAHGCSIRYLFEQPEQPLGTGGPLSLLTAEDAGFPLLVMNGDLVTQFDVADLLDHHRSAGATATVAICAYVHQVPFGVVHTTEGRVHRMNEKPTLTEMVSAGIYVFEPEALHMVPRGTTYPITDLIEKLVDDGRLVAAWELTHEWADIGRPEELAHARGLR